MFSTLSKSSLFILDIINPFPNKPWFLRVFCTSLLKTMWENEKLLMISNFSFAHSVFYTFGEHNIIFIKTLSVWKSLKIVVWGKKVKLKSSIDAFNVAC